MAEIRESDGMNKRGFQGSSGFGGRQGSRKTLWLVLVVSASLIGVGAFYLVPQFW